jgi:hypothetical protein
MLWRLCSESEKPMNSYPALKSYVLATEDRQRLPRDNQSSVATGDGIAMVFRAKELSKIWNLYSSIQLLFTTPNESLLF